MDELIDAIIQYNMYLAPTLTDDEQRELAVQEDIILAAVNEPFKVGEALKTIKDKELARGIEGGFIAYCRDKFNLSKRDAYLQIQSHEVFQVVHNCAQFNPTNVNQVRKLFGLTAEQQQAAWQQAVEIYVADNVELTGKLVAQQVKLVKAAADDNPWPGELQDDHLFQGIRKRWELMIEGITDEETEEVTYQFMGLDLYQAPEKAVKDGTSTVAPFVFIDLEKDIPSSNFSSNELLKLVEFCAMEPAWHYLLWAKDLTPFCDIEQWPSHISMVLRITQQQDFEQIQGLLDGGIPLDTLWLLPDETITLPADLPVKRVLVGTSGWVAEDATDDIAAFRQLLTESLAHTPRLAIHVATELLPFLYK